MKYTLQPIEAIAARMRVIHPHHKTSIISHNGRDAIKLCGRGAKHAATYWNRELYLDGRVDHRTTIESAKHGNGWLVYVSN